MIAEIYTKGRGIKGCLSYNLFHKGTYQIAERVAWYETLNLASNDPRTAMNIMIATFYDQNRLKREAGIGSGGRKSVDCVLHFSLGWHPEQKEPLTRNHMMQAAREALQVLGASNHQAFVVCHTDTDHPHIHLVVQRICPTDGRMLSSSKDWQKLSDWSRSYEEKHGKIYCKQRVLNHQARRRGEFTRAAKGKSRHILEFEKSAQKQGHPAQANKLIEEQRRKDHQIVKLERQMKLRHQEEWKRLQVNHQDRVRQIEREEQNQASAAVQKIQSIYHVRLAKLNAQYQKQRARLEDQSNPSGWFARFERFFQGKSASGNKAEALDQQYNDQVRRLSKRRLLQESTVNLQHQRQVQQRKSKQRRLFFERRTQLIFSQQADKNHIRSLWKQRNTQRRQHCRMFSRHEPTIPFNRVAAAERDKSPENTLSTPDVYRDLADRLRAGIRKRDPGKDRQR